MKKLVLGVASLVLLLVSGAQAQSTINYNYVEAGYQWTSYDEDGVKDGSGMESNLSVGLMDNVALEIGFNWADTEVLGVDVDAYTYKYGLVGYLDNLSECRHWLMRVGGLARTIDTMGDEDTEDGVYAGVGVRYDYLENVELNGNITYSHYDGDPNWMYEGVALLGLTDDLAFKTALGLSRDADVVLTGGLRLNF